MKTKEAILAQLYVSAVAYSGSVLAPLYGHLNSLADAFAIELPLPLGTTRNTVTPREEA